MSKPNGFRQFLILLYKGLLLRKRHYIITFFEIIIPVFLACVPCIIMSETSSPQLIEYENDFQEQWKEFSLQDATTFPPYSPYKSRTSTRYDLHLVFTPWNNLTEKFIDDAAKRFKENVGYSGKIFTKGAQSEKDMEAYSTFLQQDGKSYLLIGTVFSLNNNLLPDSLKYKIRYSAGRYGSGSNFHTEMKYRVNGPQLDSDYSTTFFLAWQASVQETFIQRKMEEKGKKVDYEVFLQRFPYPEHRISRESFGAINAVPWFVGYGFLIYMLNIVGRVIEEKSNGSKELMRMMGMTDTVYWISTFMNFFIVSFLAILIISIVYTVPLKNAYVFIKHSDFAIVFLVMLLFMAGLTLFCMAFTIFFNRAVFAVISLIIIYVVSLTLLIVFFFVTDITTNYFPIPMSGKFSICLLPHGALLTMLTMISFHESSGDGIRWFNIAERAAIPDLSMLMIICAMLLSCLIYMFIIWYFDKVWPWQNGVPKPFYFPFTYSYWCGYKSKEIEEIELVSQSENNKEFFEDEPVNSSAGVIIRNLSKEFRTGFSTKLAVNDISLNIFRGQITALLGHNGAGKTTTINILTGLFTPSKGSASINGYDILTETEAARKGIGVCPQENVLFDTLTVFEHLRIYAGLKGVSWRKLSSEAEKVMNILHLSEKKNEMVKNLSGGMKRKLSLGIAVVGGSKVLFLDEPTSGMDVEARRSLWDSLLDMRHDRTIILTTHYMEEADILGDRIAIMAEGEIQCCGSPMYLKKKFGTGYHLHIVKAPDFALNAVNAVLQNYIPGVVVENENVKEVTFKLLSNSGATFGEMFQDLETNKLELGISSYGVSVTTMEDVFLRVADISDLKYKIKESDEHINGTVEASQDAYGNSAQLKRHRNFGIQFFGLLAKRFHYAKRHFSILIAQIVLPFILVSICLNIIVITDGSYKMTFEPLELDMKKVYGKTTGFYSIFGDVDHDLAANYRSVMDVQDVIQSETKSPYKYILDHGKDDLASYLKTFLAGGSFSTMDDGRLNLTAWYNGEPYHVAPISLMMMHTALLKYVSGSGSISVTNAPLPLMLQSTQREIPSFRQKIMGCVFIPLAFSFLTASFILLPIQERASKAKLLQLMSGISAGAYWMAMFLWDMLVHSAISVLLMVPFGLFAGYVFFGMNFSSIGTMLLLMILYGWSSIPFCYLFSFLFKKPNTGFSILIAVCVIFGVAVSSILLTLQMAEIPNVDKCIWAFRIFPPFSFSMGVARLFSVSYSNAYCDGFTQEQLDFSCSSAVLEKYQPIYQCCKKRCGSMCHTKMDIITWEDYGCGRDILFLSIEGLVFFILLFLCETSLVASLLRTIKQSVLRLRRRIGGPITRMTSVEDDDVIAEEERIRNLYERRNSSGDEALIVKDLTRVFKHFYAVEHLTFGIHKEECFGLLGVNGAGKTTTFRMLTGDCHPSDGNAFIGDVSLRSHLKMFQSHLGYCPQFDALIDRLTGREMLTLFARLRGLSGRDLEERVNTLIHMIDLVPHADKQTRFYSGGNKRKLSVGVALIGSPPLILLDEPTAGVDPVSRRKIWSILSQARNITKAAIILTSHSMEESEALCSRLAIMVNGRFRCLGSIQQLKTKYGKGYSLTIKLSKEAQMDYKNAAEIKNYISNQLNGAILKDDHQGMLQYHVVNPNVTLSQLFKFMAEMKPKFDLEDYLISGTSLEQIFLTFARAQRSLEPALAV